MYMKGVEDTGKKLIINIPDTKTKTHRSFVVPETFYSTCKEYMNLRSANAATSLPFL